MKGRFEINIKRWTVWLMAVSLLFSVSTGSNHIYANHGNAQETVKYHFADVPMSHWAYRHVTKLALLGVVSGDGLNYSPNKAITQQDAVIMAVKLLGLQNELKADADVVLPFEVSKYAKPYVVLALDKGIINLREELSTLVGGDLTLSWGTKLATREWVAKAAVRAVGKQQAANELSQVASPFSDYQLISASAQGYVNAAAELKIVSGLPDGSFNPQGIVNRAQMAVILSKAERLLIKRSDHVASGLVTHMGDGFIAIRLPGGEVKQLATDGSMAVYGSDKEGRLSAADVKPYYQVSMIQLNGKVYYIEILNDEVRKESAAGTLLRKSMDGMSIVLLVDGVEQNYGLAADVSVVDVNGGGSSLGALLPRTEVEIRLNVSGVDAIVKQIIIKKLPVRESENSESEPDPEPEQTVEPGIMGTLDELDMAKMRLIIRNETGKLEVYELSPDVRVSVAGLSSAGLDDLMIGDSINMAVDEQSMVSGISVMNREIKAGVLAQIIFYDPISNKLWVRDKADSDLILQLNAAAATGNNMNRADFMRLFPNGKKAVFTISGDQILAIDSADSFDGVISTIGANTTDVTITTVKNYTFTFAIDSSTAVEVPGKSTARASDLSAGQSVRIILNAAQDKAAQIKVKRSLLVKTVAVDAAARKLTVKDHAGQQFSLTISAAVPVASANGATRMLNTIASGEPVIVSYIGSTITGLTVPSIVRGKVNAVDMAAGKLTIQDFTNAIHEITTGQKLKVYIERSEFTNLSAITPEQRVEWVTGADGSVFITVIPALDKTFWTYDSSKREISFKRKTLTETYTYSLHPDAFIHQGSEMLRPDALVENDKVSVYLLDGRIIELEKIE
jgi:hypothetical protein